MNFIQLLLLCWRGSDSPFLTTAKRLGGVHRFGESVLTTAKRVGGLQKLGECVLPQQNVEEAWRVSDSPFRPPQSV